MNINEETLPDFRDAETGAQIAENLRTIRKARGFTLELLSEQTGLSVSYISRLEAGTRRINLEILNSVSKALQCEIPDIIFGNFSNIVSFQDLGRQYGASVTGQPINYFPPPPPYGPRKALKKGDGNDVRVQRDLALYGVKVAMVGQKSPEGVFDFVKVRDVVTRPIDLQGVNNAFALLVPDNSFMPRYCAGDILMVNPAKTVTYKAPVIIIMNDDQIVSGLFQDWIEGGLSIFSLAGNSQTAATTILSQDMKAVYRITSAIYA